jgi:hypothetical protein
MKRTPEGLRSGRGMVVLSVVAFLAAAAFTADWGSGLNAQEGEKKPAAEMKVPGKSDTLLWAEKNFHYVGDKSCKLCHKAEYDSWGLTVHAKAWDVLKPEEQKNAECVECHSIGKSKSDSLLVGVGCESCHGPGSEYKAMKVMKDPKLAAAAGLLPITEATCVRCHNQRSPFYKKFVFAEALKTGVHEHPKKPETK